ncbi:hypothetical protein Tco_0839910 [Tanacetum coccineum]|uniref:Uncharacterized protein n=1 Tax=Tanacetum coccineum TaxID=301880 RepID=A0ABQ5AW23_9ASTR
MIKGRRSLIVSKLPPNMSHLHAVKRIFRYLPGQPKLWLLDPRDTPLTWKLFLIVNYVGATMTGNPQQEVVNFLARRFNFLIASIGLLNLRNLKFVDQHNMVSCLEKTKENAEFHQIVDFLSTCSINYALTVSPTIYASYIEQFWNTATSKTVNSVKQIHAIIDGNTRSERVLEKPNEPPLLEGHTSGSGEGSMEHTFELIDIVPPTPHDSSLTGGYTPKSDKGRLKLKELMAICTKLSRQVLDLEKEKDAQAVEILKLKQRDASKHGRESDKTKSMFQDSDFDVLNDDIEDVEGETVHTATTGVSAISAPVTTVGVGISTAKPRTPPTTTATAFIDEDLTIAQTLIKMKEKKVKEKGVAIKDVEDSPRPIRSITTLQPLPTIDPKDKGKGVLVEEEPPKPEKVKRRDQGLAQIESDAELAQRLHEEELAELDIAQKERQKQEEATSAALAEYFDEIQARIDADHELAVRLTHEEQEKYTIKERARLLAEFFKRRKKQLAAKRAEAIRNKPPTRTQVRNMMITYLKHMGKYTHQQLKHKTFEEIQKLYEREKNWIDDFKPIDDDSQQQAESTKKRPRADSEEESSKKQKLEEDNDAEKEELRDSMDVVPRDDVAIDVESLATKYPIVDWKTHILNENMMYYQIIRADGSSKNYKIFSEMLDDFDRQDVIDLHRLVNERYETTSPEGYDLLLWGDLKTLFEPNEEDEIWKNQQDYNLISWRLFDSCGVHVLLMNTGVAIHMMIEKKYPLTQEMLSRMLNRRLEVDYESEMAFELLRFTRSQLQK